jgi:uncharacterized protein YdaU (DUF1376 family)
MSPRVSSPAFQFYPGDYLSSSKVQRMSMTERGIYQTLLSFQWLDGSLPTDLARLASMVGMKHRQFERMWTKGALSECFIVREGRFINERLESEREKQQAFRDRQSANGKTGGRPKANPNGSQGNPGLSQVKPRVKKTEEESGEVLSSSEGMQGEPFDGQAALAELQRRYPPDRVTFGYRTQSAFMEQCPDVETFAGMVANLEQHRASHEWHVKGMAPALEKWLRDGLWRRQMSPAPPIAEQMSKSTAVTLGGAAAFVNGGR